MRLLSRSFAGGEITPELYGRIDLSKHQTGLKTCRNMVILPHGPATIRPGTEYVLEAKSQCFLIPFSYNTEQSYIIEAGDQYFRFHYDGGTVLNTAQNITAITNASPGVLTVGTHGYSTGDWVYIASVVGMTEINARWYKVVVVDPNTFSLTDLAGNAIDTTSWGTWTSGGTVASVHEVATPYLLADLFDLNFVQDADVLTIVHPTYAPRELSRVSANSFSLSTIAFDPALSPPTTVSVAVGSGPGSTKYRYAVTAVADAVLEESRISEICLGSTTKAITGATQANPGVITAVGHGLAVDDPIQIDGVVGMTELNDTYYLVNTAPSANTLTLKTLEGVVVDTSAYTAYSSGGTITYAFIANDLTGVGAYNNVTWSAVSGAIRYKVYKYDNGLWGYIGETTELKFWDDNITPDVSTTPPFGDNPFSGADDYPSAASYFEQRRLFGNTNNKPQNYWLTRSGTDNNLTRSIPTRDDDTIQGRIVSRQVNEIRHFIPLSELLVFTSGGEWRIGSSSGALTPTSLEVRPQSYIGASTVIPQVTGNSVLYVQARGSRIRELTYSWEASSYRSLDISIMAPHLFDGLTILDNAYATAPEQVYWAVRSDGTLLGMTYAPEHEVSPWHHHDTQGTFESCASIPESDQDALYVSVKRTINSREVYYIERLHVRAFTALEDWFGVDAGLTYDGAAATTISGLWHLEGESVTILADGAVLPVQTVSNGTITLTEAASKVHVGLGFTADFESLPVGLSAELQGRKKNVNRVHLRVNKSSGITMGPDVDNLRQYPLRTTEAYGSPPALRSEEIQMDISPTWNKDGSVFIRQADPLPLTIVSMTLEVESGG